MRVDHGAFYAVALAQRAASRSVNSPVMRLTTKVAPDSTSEASRPEISTCASMGTADEPGACPATTLKVIAVFTRVPPWSSLPREDTCPVIAVASSSSATFARKVTLAGPNFTVKVVAYEPSSSRSPSFAPGTQSTTARGSDSTSHTIRGAAGTSTRSLISITMWTGQERVPGRHCFCGFVAVNSSFPPASRPKPVGSRRAQRTGQHGLPPVLVRYSIRQRAVVSTSPWLVELNRCLLVAVGVFLLNFYLRRISLWLRLRMDRR